MILLVLAGRQSSLTVELYDPSSVSLALLSYGFRCDGNGSVWIKKMGLLGWIISTDQNGSGRLPVLIQTPIGQRLVAYGMLASTILSFL